MTNTNHMTASKHDQYLPAQPGLMLLTLFDNRCMPIIGWMIPGTQRQENILRTCNVWALSPWPITPAGMAEPGGEPRAIGFPNGRVFEPGIDQWYDSADIWRAESTDIWHAKQRGKKLALQQTVDERLERLKSATRSPAKRFHP